MPLKIKDIIWIPESGNLEKERKWIEKEIKSTGIKKLQTLSIRASKAKGTAYTPYSKYNVGAALLRKSGKVDEGQNIEVVTYSETGHAEEQAIKNAVSKGAVKEGGRKFIKAIAVSHAKDTAPCGKCRQIIVEFCDNALVIVADSKGTIKRITSIKLLLPYAFTASDLRIK
ncbi:cytidine deaminase [Patescibacteria group bacterium]|nr:cytidine deaminase [Patescibacteria group bacterium]